MKKRIISLLLSLCMTASLLLVFAVTSSAAETKTLTLNLDDFNANPNDSKDDTAAIQSALDKAINAKNPVVINGSKGTYYISENLRIYSNTTFNLPKDTKIIANYAEGPMIYGAHRNSYGSLCYGSSCSHGSYSQTSNITISGGIWDRNSKYKNGDNSIISFRHAKNITIKNLTGLHANDHFINISGVDTALVSGVTLKDAVTYTGTDSAYWGNYKKGDSERYNSIEAIHLDYCNKSGENSDRAMPYDNTPSKNITVKNCTFDNVYACVGTHHAAVKGRASKIEITNNKFNNIRAYCIYAYDFDNLTIKNNTAVKAGSLCTVFGSKATIADNSFTSNNTASVNKNGIYLFGSTTATVSGNTIKGAKLSGLSAYDNCKVTAKNNTISSSAANGIAMQKSCKLTASNNKIGSSKGCGIYLNGGSTINATKNEITKSGTHALYMTGKSSGTFSNNMIKTTSKAAVRNDGGSKLKAEGNSVTSPGEFAFYATGNSPLNANKNTIYGTGSSKPAIKVVNSKSSITNNIIKSSKNHGIVISESNSSTVKGNTITKTSGVGIHIYCSKSCSVADNKVNSTGHALLVEGTKSKNASAAIKSNKLTSSAGKDLRLGTYAKKCTLESNTLGKKTLSVDSTASYTTLASKVTLNKKSATLGVGKTLTVKATVSPSNTNNKSITWSTSNNKVATVNKNGKITAKKKGTATITATTKNGKKATCKITVK